MPRQRSRRERLETALSNYKSRLRVGISKVIDDATEQFLEDVNDLHFEMEDWAEKMEGTNLENSKNVERVRRCAYALDELSDFLMGLSAGKISLAPLIPETSEIKFPSMFLRR